MPGFSSVIGGVLLVPGVLLGVEHPPPPGLGVVDRGGAPTLLGVGVLRAGGAGLELSGRLGVAGLAGGVECVESVLAGRGASKVTVVTLRSGRFSVSDVGD